MPKGKKPYPGGVPKKFDPEGRVQLFPGNTIVSNLSTQTDLFDSMLVLYGKLAKHPLAHLYVMLPPASWHMTVFEGVCDQVRKPGYWPSDLDMDASLETCSVLFADKLSEFDLQCEPPYLMKVTGFSDLKSGMGVRVEPRTPEEGKRLQNLRDRLADLLNIRHPDHDTYGLHLSMGYMLRHLSEEQMAQLREVQMDHFKAMPLEFELGAPEYCTFRDMFAYNRVFYLKDREK